MQRMPSAPWTGDTTLPMTFGIGNVFRCHPAMCGTEERHGVNGCGHHAGGSLATGAASCALSGQRCGKGASP